MNSHTHHLFNRRPSAPNRGWGGLLIAWMLAICGLAPIAKANELSMLVSVGNLYNGAGTGTSIGGNGLIVMVASGGSGAVPNPAGGGTLGGAWGGNHEVLFTATAGTGLGAAPGGLNTFFANIPVILATQGNPVALFWFPGKSSLSDTLALGNKFGRYSDTGGTETGLPWTLPSSGGTLELQFRAGAGFGLYNTGSGTYNGRSHPISSGEASLTVTDSQQSQRIIALGGNLQFGGVAIGGSATRTMTVKNLGNAPLTVSSLSFPTGFTGNWAGGVIPALGSMNLTVTFSPTSGEDFGGTVSVASNASGGGNSLNCSGWGLGNSQLTDALDGWNWTTGGSGIWRRDNNNAQDGNDSAISPATSNSEESSIKTTFIGPGTLSYWWKVSSEQNYDYLVLQIDGVERQKISGEVDWREVVATVGPGAHEVKLIYRKDISIAAGWDAGWVDAVAFVTENPPQLVKALDEFALHWTSSGNSPWSAQSATSKDSVSAAQSGLVGNARISDLETTVSGAGNLTFWWKVSSESGFDFFEFYIDGVLQTGRISGSLDWAQKTYALAAGSHNLRWRYIKNSSVSSGSDAGWLDQIVWIPADAYSSWSAGFFSAAQLPDPTISGPAADPDRDGISNLLEFVLGGNPTVGSTAVLPTSAYTPSNGGQNMILRFNRKMVATGVTQVVEYSTSPSGDWHPAVNGSGGVTIATTLVDATTQQVTVTIPFAGTKGFARLKVFN